MKRVTVLKTRIAELQGEQERAVRERTEALKAVSANPSDDAGHARLDAAVNGCKQLSDIIDHLQAAVDGAKLADDADLLESNRADMLAARDRAQGAVVARVQAGAEIDKALTALRVALTKWQTYTSEAKRELGLATVGALDVDLLPTSVFENRHLQLNPVREQLDNGGHAPLALAQGLRRAGICGPLGTHVTGPHEGPIPLSRLIEFHVHAAGTMVLNDAGTVREAAQRAADSFVSMLDNWHARCNVIDVPAVEEPEVEADDNLMPSAADESRETHDE